RQLIRCKAEHAELGTPIEQSAAPAYDRRGSLGNGKVAAGHAAWYSSWQSAECHMKNMSILQLSNVERIAAVIQRALNEVPDNRQPTRTAYSPEVTLQLVARDSSDIYCVPGADANITCFMSLTAALGGEVTVHGLQPRGLDGMLTPHGRVDAA